MSFGRLGTAVLAAGNEQSVYTVPAVSVGAEVNINILNPNASTDAVVEVALTTGANAAASEFIEKGVILSAGGGTLENTGLIMGPGEKVNVKSNIAGVVVRVSGKELASL